MQDYYLICENCNGYYKLEEGENPDSFEDQCSICGGDLILVNDIDYYLDEQYTKTYYDTPNHQKTLGRKSFVILGLCILISLTLIPNSPLSNLLSLHNSLTHDNSFLGSDNRGYVTKEVYSNYGSYSPKIAVITGMHPREISAKVVVPNVIRSYALTHNVEIVNYQINVTDNPQDYTTGRKNGEGLVAQYVVPDIEKSDYNLVIIVHNHEQSYGNGYYIATPTMDDRSASMAANIHNILPDFNYYQRSADETPHSTSITKVDNPIAAAGTPVFVYEIPEWVGNSDVYSNSNRLIDACFNFLNQ